MVDVAAVPKTVASASGRIAAVVVLEDFLGTGATAEARLKALNREWTAEGPWPSETVIYLVAICGFDDAMGRVRRVAESLELPVRLHVADTLDDRDRCFGEQSPVFPEEADRELARSIAYERGAALEPKHPLGYEDSEALVCFEARCPNNTLPILWKEAPNWEPLFPR